jgi:hypothetical protein
VNTRTGFPLELRRNWSRIREPAFDVGVDNGTPVSTNYNAKDHFPFTGQIDRVVINLIAEGDN